ncbi:unnamed protein product [Rotaria sp. Silwood1]|nr:unnamed protein product [Rotaria sp. Silwood1]
MEDQLRSAYQSNAISSFSSYAGHNRGYYYSTKHNDSISLLSPSNGTEITASATTAETHGIPSNGRRIEQCYKLLSDCDVQMRRVRRVKNNIEKIHFFRRWKNHHINFDQSEITSTKNQQYMDKSIAYSIIENISVWSKSKLICWHDRFGIRIVTNNHNYFFRVNTLDLRDQLFYSIQWRLNKFKFEHIFRSADNPEELLKEIRNMINITMTTPIEDSEIHPFVLDIISEILQQQEFDSSRLVREDVIAALSPLLEINYPSPEMCDFFSRHCRDSPRSQIVIEMFTPTVQRILKHNVNFSAYPRIKLLLQEYFLALNSQNDGLLVVEDFIKRLFKNVVKNLVEDTRCEVHRTVLGIREGKDGWFEMFCLDGIVCDDNGEMFSLMLSKLISCCCRQKDFLLSINKLLPSLMLLALHESESSLNTLCAMLDLDAVENHDNKLQLISTLESMPSGLKMYAKVCERQRALQALQQKDGPRDLTLPSCWTDNDFASLLSSGPFGNLESLSLAFTNVTSACAEHLIKLPALKYINLWSTRFGDAGLELISQHLNQLEVLNLSETSVTDKGLTYLAKMKMLRKLYLNSTNLSTLAIQALKV